MGKEEMNSITCLKQKGGEERDERRDAVKGEFEVSDRVFQRPRYLKGV